MPAGLPAWLPGRGEVADAPLLAISASRSLSDLVADYLIQQLVSGRLAQGQRINEAELARALGISRNPIREAISGLHERGMLIAAPRRGSFVRRFTIDDVNEIFSFRTALERFTVQAAVKAAGQPDMARLSGLFEDMVHSAERDDVHSVRKSDMLFHAEIARISGNRHAINAFETLSTEILMLMTIPHQQVESLQASAADHAPLLEAFRARSPSAARHEIGRHLRNAWILMLQLYASRPADDRAGAVA